MNKFDCIRALSKVRVGEKICCFTKTLLNINPNFIPHERIICDYKDKLWINNEIKKTNKSMRRILLKVQTSTSSKTYWSILKTFLNNKEMPRIPPLFHENKFITNFNEEAELFNVFFFLANHCTLMNNSNVLLVI